MHVIGRRKVAVETESRFWQASFGRSRGRVWRGGWRRAGRLDLIKELEPAESGWSPSYLTALQMVHWHLGWWPGVFGMGRVGVGMLDAALMVGVVRAAERSEGVSSARSRASTITADTFNRRRPHSSLTRWCKTSGIRMVTDRLM